MQTSFGRNGNLEGNLCILWGRTYVARRNLDVFGPQRAHHIAGREIQLGQTIRVQPDAHTVLARTEQSDFSYSFHPREHVSYVEKRVVTEVQLVKGIVG